MRKLIAFVLGLFITLPVFAGECNLFNKDDSSLIYRNRTLAVSDGNQDIWRYIQGSTSIAIPCSANTTYTISGIPQGSSFYRFGTINVSSLPASTDTTNIPLSSIERLTSYVSSYTLTTPAGATHIVIQVGSSIFNNFLNTVKVEEGSSATPYTPYDAQCNNTCPNGQVLQTYTSATGTVTQSPAPTPSAPVYPTFYTQGNMVLRKVGDYADSYDASTGKITRRVGVLVLKGDEDFTLQSVNDYGIANFSGYTPGNSSNTINSSHFSTQSSLIAQTKVPGILRSSTNSYYIRIESSIASTVPEFKSWLAAQYAAGTPVTIYYYLGTRVEEDWTETSYCQSPIKIATTAYNSARFSPVVTELNDTIATIRDVVTNTINQTKAIADLQATKQTRPDENCPAGKKCLLVEDNDGTPHWYEIIENAD